MQRQGEHTRSRASAEERTRLRRNQRNSRARRQAYVEDLERRWSDCVAKGAQATTEMQQVARKVHSENAMLRTILQDSGIGDDLIAQRMATLQQAQLPAAQVNHTPTSVSAVSGHPVPLVPAPSATPGQFALSGTVSPTQGYRTSAVNSVDSSAPNSFLGGNSSSAVTPGWPDGQWPPLGHPLDYPLLIDEAHAPETIQASSPEWDLFSWLTDLSSIKDAYGAEVQDFAADDQTIQYAQGQNYYSLTDTHHQYMNAASVLDHSWPSTG